jgi:predicted dehydrogenase
MSTKKLYNIGVIGAGMIALQHLEHIRKSGRAEVSWIAALRPDNLEMVRSRFGIKYKTHNYRDMLADSAVDVILITTPPHLHREMFKECLKAGKHVLLEKPMAITTEELEDLLECKKKHPQLLAMDCSGRHARLSPKFRKVKGLIDSGLLGDVYRVHHQSVARQGRPGIEFHPEGKWFLDRTKAGGGPIFDWGVYDLSFHLGVLGDRHQLEHIDSVLMKRGLDETDPGTDVYDVEEHFAISMKFSEGLSYYWERGAHANVEVPNETRIYGTRGGIKLAYCTWDDPDMWLYDLDQYGKARKQKLDLDMSQHSHDGYALWEHFFQVLDGHTEPVISLELAKKHLDIIIKCCQFSD